MKTTQFQLPDKIKCNNSFVSAHNIIKKLTSVGFKAYFVGGCVRDMLLNIVPKDFDVVTDALPEDIKKIFKKTIPVGEKFGIMIVLNNSIQTEVATFRSDCEYNDGRRPIAVTFSNEKEDSMRRDFTINGLFYDVEKGTIIDYTGGMDDIKQKVIRCIGNPYERFREDKLRILRAIRFSLRFNFAIETETWNALTMFANKIEEVSKERIRDELTKIFIGSSPGKALSLINSSKILEKVLPEIAALKNIQQPKEFHPEGDVFEHTKIMLELSENEKANICEKELFPWAVIFHDVGKLKTMEITGRIRFNNHDVVGSKMTAHIADRLKFSKSAKEYMVSMVRDHMKFISVNKMRKSTQKKFFRLSHFNDLLILLKLDCLASHGDLGLYETSCKIYKEISEEPLAPIPLIMGRDLIELGFEPSPEFKKILSSVEDLQLEGKINSKQEAIDFVEKTYLKK